MTPEDAEIFTTYWTAAQRSVAAFVRTLVPDFNEADDIVQRVAVVLVRKFNEYDHERPFVAWAIGIAKREIVIYRHERNKDRHIFKESLIEQIAETYQRSPDLPISEQLARCLEALDIRWKQIIHLRYAQDLRTRQISDRTGMTDVAVRKLLSRARMSLRDCLNRERAITRRS